jgi:hypothetical protein
MARTAATTDGPARLTLDHDVRVLGHSAFPATAGTGGTARPNGSGAKKQSAGLLPAAVEPDAGLPVLDGRVILELKYRHHLPTVFKRLVEEFALAPQRASKYRLGITALDAVPSSELIAAGRRGHASHA